MRFLKAPVNRIWNLVKRFNTQIIYLLVLTITILVMYFLVDRLSGLEIAGNIDNKEILIQAILIASTALIGVTGVFMTVIWFSLAGKSTRRMSYKILKDSENKNDI